MNALADKLAERLETEGYKSISKLKFARLPHKTIAFRAGLGFIGKNNLLINNQYACFGVHIRRNMQNKYKVKSVSIYSTK